MNRRTANELFTLLPGKMLPHPKHHRLVQPTHDIVAKPLTYTLAGFITITQNITKQTIDQSTSRQNRNLIGVNLVTQPQTQVMTGKIAAVTARSQYPTYLNNITMTQIFPQYPAQQYATNALLPL